MVLSAAAMTRRCGRGGHTRASHHDARWPRFGPRARMITRVIRSDGRMSGDAVDCLLNTAVPIIASPHGGPTASDFAYLRAERGGDAVEGRAHGPIHAPITISVTRVESSLPIPNTLVTARRRASLRIRSRMIASPTRSLSRLRCLRRLGGVDRPAAPTVAPRRSDRGRGRIVRLSRADGYGGRRCLRPERPYLFAARADGPPAAVGHLVPDAGDIAEGFGDDQPGIVREFLQQLYFGM